MKTIYLDGVAVFMQNCAGQTRKTFYLANIFVGRSAATSDKGPYDGYLDGEAICITRCYSCANVLYLAQVMHFFVHG